MADEKRDLVGTIARLARGVERLCDRSIRFAGCTGSQSRVLCYLIIATQDQDVFQKDVERTFGIRSSSVTGLLQDLEAAGFIRREAVAADARLKRIALTDKTRQLQTEILENHQRIVEKLQGALSEEELERFLDCCVTITANAANP